MKVRIDAKRCTGHAVCHLVAPTVFDTGDDGYGLVVKSTVGGTDADAASLAEARCPERAVVLEEDACSALS
jgi:ferredoxin